HRWTGSVLERIAYRISCNGRFVRLASLEIGLTVDVDTLFERLFGVSPGTAGIVLENSHQYARNRYPSQCSTEHLRTEKISHHDGRYEGNQARRNHLPNGSLRRDSHTFVVFGLARPLQDTRNLP